MAAAKPRVIDRIPLKSDDRESLRIPGALLTRMAERTTSVFIAAASNSIEALPPELVRKGRLDEIFFVDLHNDARRSRLPAFSRRCNALVHCRWQWRKEWLSCGRGRPRAPSWRIEPRVFARQ
jgi:ATP-dependent 26S proteasome regulatory subunit